MSVWPLTFWPQNLVNRCLPLIVLRLCTKSPGLRLFSASELKAQVHYCDHASSVVRPWSLTFHIFEFYSETAERNSMKLHRKRNLNVLYQVCVSGWLEKQDGRPGLWLAETFSTSPMKSQKGIQRNLIESKILMSSAKFVFFKIIGKTDGRPGLWFAETLSTSPLKPLKRNSTKLDKQQDLSVLYKVWFFWGGSEKQDGSP